MLALYLFTISCELFMNKEFANFLSEKLDINDPLAKDSRLNIPNKTEQDKLTEKRDISKTITPVISKLASQESEKKPEDNKLSEKKDNLEDVSIQPIKIKDKDAVLIKTEGNDDKPKIIVLADQELINNQEELKKLPSEFGSKESSNKQPKGNKKEDDKKPGDEKKVGEKKQGNDKKENEKQGAIPKEDKKKESPLVNLSSQESTKESEQEYKKLDFIINEGKEKIKNEPFWTTIMLDNEPKRVKVNIKTFTILESIVNKQTDKENKEGVSDKSIFPVFNFGKNLNGEREKDKNDILKKNSKENYDILNNESQNKTDLGKKETNDKEKIEKKLKNKEKEFKKSKDDEKKIEKNDIKYEASEFEKLKKAETESIWSSIFKGSDEKPDPKRLNGDSDAKFNSKSSTGNLPMGTKTNEKTKDKEGKIKNEKNVKEKFDGKDSKDIIEKKFNDKVNSLDKKGKNEEKIGEKEEKKLANKKEENKNEEKIGEKEEKKLADKKEENKNLEKIREKEEKKLTDKKEENKNLEKIREKEEKKLADKKEENKNLEKIEKSTKKVETEKDSKKDSADNSKKALESVIFEDNNNNLKKISSKKNLSSKKDSSGASMDDLLYVLKNMPGKVNINKEGKEIYIEGDFVAPKERNLEKMGYKFSGVIKSKTGKLK